MVFPLNITQVEHTKEGVREEVEPLLNICHAHYLLAIENHVCFFLSFLTTPPPPPPPPTTIFLNKVHPSCQRWQKYL